MTGVHDAANQSRVYKDFTFGRLNGDYTVQERRITFTDSVQLEIRSIHEELIRTLSDGFRRQDLVLVIFWPICYTVSTNNAAVLSRMTDPFRRERLMRHVLRPH